ncbi:ANTAR domain-containing protein [Variovorax beijingensis]|jgi:response regulator NasT|uniref:Aliphatic amidase regulator n=2 Tax=Variovorax TaxID=34072 RepID=A0A0H2M8H3_VARPD|nr:MULTISPECIES: ANTAR domain-containing protein [Variovorax]KLN53355.1 aliphatic amidase regulator [Variovorax paradoxus]RRH86835.1 ANTAR domain-containing protein [Variovorax beijingensis]RSZ32880.1 ANTAR domain-containing protein [Variovorax beijingensis]
MAISLLRELPELKVVVVHPPDEEGDALVSHLRRVGCMVSVVWPVPVSLVSNADVLFLLIEGEARHAIEALLKSLPKPEPTVIAILNYEDPTTLQLVLESGAFAVVQKPIKPFGLLANLVAARSNWMERQALLKENRKLRRKITSDQAMSRAKTILMASKGISEVEAYQAIRAQAMSKRLSMEQIASSIINMETLLQAAN